MAETQIFDQLKSAGEAISRPSYVNVYAPGYKPTPGPTARGFKTALSGAKAAAGGLVALAGDVTGIDRLRDYGLGVSARASADAAKTAMRVEDVDSFSGALDFGKYAVGSTGANLLTLLAGGLVGRAAGAAAAKGVQGAADKLILKNAGLTAGLAGSSIAQETGSIYPEAVETGVPDAAARAVFGGVAAGSLDAVPAAMIARRLGLFGRAASAPASAAGKIKQVAKGAATAGVAEGATEVGQTAIERLAAGKDLQGAEAFSDYINSAALGAVGGAVPGGAASGVESLRQPVASRTQAGALTPTDTRADVQRGTTAPAATVEQAAPTPAEAPPQPLELVYEPDRLSLVDNSPSPATADELRLLEAKDTLASTRSRLTELDVESRKPKGERRTRQEIVSERKALAASIPALEQTVSNREAILAGPKYSERTPQARPTIIGEQPAAVAPAKVITPAEDSRLRTAEKAAAAPGAAPVLTQIALDKRARGELLSTEEAVAARTFDRGLPAIEQVRSRPRSSAKQPSGKSARDNFVNVYATAVDAAVDDYATLVAMPKKRADALKADLHKAAENAVSQKDAESAQRALDVGFKQALKNRIADVDKDGFAEQLSLAVQRGAPNIVTKYFSQGAVERPDKIAFSHWGDVPGGVTDPAKIGTGVSGADWYPAREAGVQYTSAVVRGSNYREPAVQARTQYVGVLDAAKVYQARSDDPLLAQAREEVLPTYGPDESAAWMRYAAKVRDLGYDAMQYAGGQLRIFTRQKVYRELTKQDAAAMAKTVVDIHRKGNGSSYNVAAGEDVSGSRGYAVSAHKGREEIVPGKELSVEAVRRFIDNNFDLLADPRNIIGTWYNEADDSSYIDVSAVVPQLGAAMDIAASADQLAVFDLRSATSIQVGHPLFNSAQDYAASAGLMPLQEVPYAEVDVARMTMVAKAYDRLVAKSDDPLVLAAYDAMAADVEAQFAAASKVINIEPWRAEGQPYANSAEMRKDVFENGHIWVFEGGDPHPYFTQEQNWKFRAVHDLYGHAKTGFEFGPRGELNATRAHAQMFSPAAVPALVTETIGQNSWVNYGEQNANLPAEQRAYAEQKVDLLPEALWRPFLEDGSKLASQAAARVDIALGDKGQRMLAALRSIVGTPARLDVYAAPQVPGGTGSITFGQARDVIALSTRALDGDSLAAHEGYHYLEYRVLGRPERAIVANAFRRSSSTFKTLVSKAREYDRANGTSITDEIIANPQEARAYGYEFWQRGELDAGAPLARVWQKIKQLAERVANLVRGNGFQSYEDVFRAIKLGQYADRGDAGLAAYERYGDTSLSRAGQLGALEVDVPNETWLKEQVDYAKSRPRSRYGVPYMGKITGSFREHQTMAVADLAKIKGERGEQDSVRKEDLNWLVNEMRTSGLDNVGVPYIEVGYDGVPWVSEGNHRIMAAKQLGWDTMPVEIRYFDGGEREARGAVSPGSLSGRTSLSKAATATDTPQFKAWFGDSKVVDASGKPLVVYHGTVRRPDTDKVKNMGDIEVFDRMFTTKFRRPSIDTVGSWFSDNPGDGGALMYAGGGRAEGGTIYPVYLSIKNPHETTFQLLLRRARLLANGVDDGRQVGAPEVAALRTWLKAMGKDGIKIAHDPGADTGSTEFSEQTAWVVLEPEQVKSATGNTGAFDPGNPNILFSQAATADSSVFPDVDTITGISVGPGGRIVPRTIAPGRELYRETGVDGLDDILRMDKQADASAYFVSDNPDLAIGQGYNTGVRVVFRPNSLSGAEHKKPGTGDIAGREYRTDIVAPRAVQTITMRTGDVKKLRGLTRIALKDFDREELAGGYVRFNRKGLPRAASDVLFSQAATADSLAEMALRVKEGELPRTQLNVRIAEMMDNRAVPQGLRDRIVDPSLDEMRAVGGSVKRFVAENLMSGQNLARKSTGYKNVFNVLTAYAQRKNVLIVDAVDKRLSSWVSGSSKKDKVAVSAALLKRTENAYTTGSDGYTALRSGLTEQQRVMFDQATAMIADRLDAELETDAVAYRRVLDDAAYQEWYKNRFDQVQRLKDEGYFPERRFGDHVVHAYVTAPNGKRVTAYYSQHEREADARKELDELNRLAGDQGLTFEYGYRYRAEYDASISFSQFLATAERSGVALTQPERERIGRALISADSTRRNRVFRRQNVAGYSQDGMRVLAEFGVTMANKIAYSELGDALNDALSGLEVDVKFDNRGQVEVNSYAGTDTWSNDGEMSGFYRNLADQTAEFVLSPRQGSKVSSGLRGAATMHFLGGSIAAGMVNMSSLPMNTVPWLTQHTSYTDAMGKVLGATKLAAQHFRSIVDLPTLLDESKRLDGIDDVEGLRHALQVAAQDGTILDTEIYQIMGLTRGQEYSMSGAAQKAVRVWMAPFRLAEQMNRIATFTAAFKVAKEKKLDNEAAYKLAQDTVYSTQFRYDEANRPALARGDWGSMLFVFKSYPIFVLETMSFLARENPRSAAFMLGSLVLMAGIQGLPFAEDLEDLIDTLAQRLFNEPFNTQRWLRNTLKSASEATVGMDLSPVLMHGMANTFTELNFASRVGLGNLIPGTRIGAADADYKSVMTEVIGPIGSLVGGVLSGADALNRGEFTEAARSALPLGAQNVVKGWQAWEKGYATDIGGRRLVDVGGWEAFWQSLGMSSAAVSDAYVADRIDRQTVAFYTKARASFQADIVRAVKSGDTGALADATAAVQEWNQAHPDMVMSISPQSVRRAIAQSGMTIDQRTLARMPKALRASSESALGLDEE